VQHIYRSKCSYTLVFYYIHAYSVSKLMIIVSAYSVGRGKYIAMCIGSIECCTNKLNYTIIDFIFYCSEIFELPFDYSNPVLSYTFICNKILMQKYIVMFILLNNITELIIIILLINNNINYLHFYIYIICNIEHSYLKSKTTII
jgi:hypothetical protein